MSGNFGVKIHFLDELLRENYEQKTNVLPQCVWPSVGIRF